MLNSTPKPPPHCADFKHKNTRKKEEKKNKNKTAEATQIETSFASLLMARQGQTDHVHKMKVSSTLLEDKQSRAHLTYARHTTRHLGDEGLGEAAAPAYAPFHTLPGMGMVRIVALADPNLPPEAAAERMGYELRTCSAMAGLGQDRAPAQAPETAYPPWAPIPWGLWGRGSPWGGEPTEVCRHDDDPECP